MLSMASRFFARPAYFAAITPHLIRREASQTMNGISLRWRRRKGDGVIVMGGGHVARDGRHYEMSEAIGIGQPGSPNGVDDDYR